MGCARHSPGIRRLTAAALRPGPHHRLSDHRRVLHPGRLGRGRRADRGREHRRPTQGRSTTTAGRRHTGRPSGLRPGRRGRDHDGRGLRAVAVRRRNVPVRPDPSVHRGRRYDRIPDRGVPHPAGTSVAPQELDAPAATRHAGRREPSVGAAPRAHRSASGVLGGAPRLDHVRRGGPVRRGRRGAPGDGNGPIRHLQRGRRRADEHSRRPAPPRRDAVRDDAGHCRARRGRRYRAGRCVRRRHRPRRQRVRRQPVLGAGRRGRDARQPLGVRHAPHGRPGRTNRLGVRRGGGVGAEDRTRSPPGAVRRKRSGRVERDGRLLVDARGRADAAQRHRPIDILHGIHPGGLPRYGTVWPSASGTSTSGSRRQDKRRA